MDEIVDIRDGSHRIIAQAAKADAHARGLLHCCAIGLLINPRGDWTLVRQAADRQDAGQLVSPVGGHVVAGEAIEDALRRETLEEIGLQDVPFKPVGATVFRRMILGRDENHHFHFFELHTDREPILGAEAVAFETFRPQELAGLVRAQPHLFGHAFHFAAHAFYPEHFGAVDDTSGIPNLA
ncbi:NUDIX hydrolase [Candidatus Parcubacteria bacterium]|nr:MAG: NUDIX hydrolase [Candidatus Parcubacteria bacterium]